MRKIAILLAATIIISLSSCATQIEPKIEKEYIKDNNYVYDSNDNIILCKELPQYGYIDYDMRVSDFASYNDFKEKYTDRSKQIESIISGYRTAADNKDYIIADYQDGVSVVKYNGSDTKLIIPKELDGKKVIKLGGYINKEASDSDTEYKYVSPLFEKDITEITIPQFVNEISYGFFYSDYFDKSKSLEKINVDNNNNIFSSDNGVLYDKNKKALLCVPENYSESVFSIPTGVTTIYDFYSKNTTDLEIPSTVKKIASLSGKTYLHNSNNWYCSNYNVENNIASIKVSDDNPNYSSGNGVLYNKTKSELLIYPPKKPDNHFAVPDSVEKIAPNEADDFKHLVTLSFGKNIKEINLHNYLESSIQVVKGYKGTAAEKYAKKNNLTFVPL
jgi:hypothetical protein